MSFISTPSLASATSTSVDSACKHIQQCRVSYDHMLDFVGNAHELERNKMQYCVHKDEMAVGVSRPWEKETVRQLPISAYPRVVSNLGDITTNERHKIPLRMIKYLYHFSPLKNILQYKFLHFYNSFLLFHVIYYPKILLSKYLHFYIFIFLCLLFFHFYIRLHI